VSHALVNSLMDPYSKRWNEPVVRQVSSEDLFLKFLTHLFLSRFNMIRYFGRLGRMGVIQCVVLTDCVSMS
jgi:hypothetical protein